MVQIYFNILNLLFKIKIVIPAKEVVSQLKSQWFKVFRHSGLDPESSPAMAGLSPYFSGCRIKSGMT